jgi:hypothetical protein
LPFHLARAALRDPRSAARTLTHDVILNFLRRSVLRAFPSAPVAEPVEGWLEGASDKHRNLVASFLEAGDSFRPRPYSGAMTYFLPEVRRLHIYADPLPVWRGVTNGALTLERVPGPHVGMVSGAPGRVIASRIDAQLRS